MERQRQQLLEHQTGKEKFKRKLHLEREVFCPEDDIAVLEYLETERSEGRVVRNKDIQKKTNRYCKWYESRRILSC